MILPFGRTRYNQIDLMKKAILIRAFRGELMGQVQTKKTTIIKTDTADPIIT